MSDPIATDLLIFGPHPDDIELGLGATIAKHVDEGYRVALVDLTAAELSSNGSPEQRHSEAAEAARVLGVASRENLGWADGGIATTSALIRSATDAIRRHRPRAVAIPHWDDRHPDHVAASEVLAVAAFRSGLRRFITDTDAWRPDWTCYYFINGMAEPSFVIDVSAHYDRKWAALACYRSQFAAAGNPGDDRVSTRLTSPAFRTLIESRDAQLGARVGVAFAEGVVVREPIVRGTLFKGSRETVLSERGESNGPS